MVDVLLVCLTICPLHDWAYGQVCEADVTRRRLPGRCEGSASLEEKRDEENEEKERV